MKNRYLRAAVWMLTVLMVLGCLPLGAMAEGVVTDNSPALAAVDLLDGSRSVNIEGGSGAGITANTSERWGSYTTSWKIPVYLYSENDNGTLTLLGSSTISTQSSGYGYQGWGWQSTPVKVTINANNSAIASLLGRYQYSSVRFVMGNSAQTGTTVSSISLETTGTDSTSLSYDGGSIASSEYENNAVFVIIKAQGDPFTVTVSGSQDVTLSADYPSTVESATGDLLTITLPTGAQVEVSEGYMITGWQDSFGNVFAPGEEVIVGATTQFTPVVEKLIKVTFVQNTDGSGAGQSRNMYVTNGSYLTFPELYSGWEVEGSIFVGWSTDAQGDEQVYDQSTNGVFSPNTQWVSGADKPNKVQSEKTFYAIWIDPDREELTTAQFAIRLDGIMPFEPTDHGTGGYGEPMTITNALKSPTSVINNVAAVRENLAAEPTLEQVYNSINGESHVYGSNLRTQNDDGTYTYNFEVRWYVIKKLRDTTPWHVDGIIVPVSYYTVYYDANGGTNAPGSVIYKANANVDVNLKDVPSRAGYIFKGWAETADATTPKYATGGTTSFTMPANDVTLYAVWQASSGINYTVQYYLQKSDGSFADEPDETSTYKGVTGSLVSAPQKAFTGYTVDTNYKDTVASGTVEPDGSLVLKLYYTRDTGSMTISKSVSNANAAATFDVTVSGIDEGYSTFGGYTVTDGTVTIPVPKNGSVTLNNIPADTYTVAETSASSRGYTVSYEGLDGNGQVKVTKDNAPTVKVTNTLKAKDITITKQVTGNFGDRTYDFQFTAIVKVGDEQVSITDADDYTVADDGTVTFGLKNGESVTLKDVPTEAIVTVTETAVTGYTTQYMLGQDTYTGTSVSLNVAGDQIGVTFINDRTAQIDTGVDLDTIPYVVMLLSIFGAGALWLIGRRRRTQN